MKEYSFIHALIEEAFEKQKEKISFLSGVTTVIFSTPTSKIKKLPPFWTPNFNK